MHAVGVWVGVGLAQDASVHEGTVLVNNAHLRPREGVFTQTYTLKIVTRL